MLFKTKNIFSNFFLKRTQYGKVKEAEEKKRNHYELIQYSIAELTTQRDNAKKHILNANRTRCHLFAHRFTYAALYCQLHR